MCLRRSRASGHRSSSRARTGPRASGCSRYSRRVPSRRSAIRPARCRTCRCWLTPCWLIGKCVAIWPAASSWLRTRRKSCAGSDQPGPAVQDQRLRQSCVQSYIDAGLPTPLLSTDTARSSTCTSSRCDIAATRRFFTTTIAAHREPEEVVTDQAAALANVIEDLFLQASHNTIKYANTVSSATTNS